MGTIDRIFERAAALLGCTAGQAKALICGFLFVLALGFYLAGTAVSSLSSQYDRLAEEAQSEAARDDDDDFLTPAQLRERQLRERGRLPQLLIEGQIVPDAPLRPDGTALRCGELLQGQSGLTRGWIWIPEERGCRRVAPQR